VRAGCLGDGSKEVDGIDKNEVVKKVSKQGKHPGGKSRK
jgi:hypothetical protein